MLQRLADAVNIGVLRRQTIEESFALHQAVFSREGDLLVTAGKSPSASVWNVVTKQKVQTLPLFIPDVSWRYSDSVEFCTDGTRLITSALPATVRIWKVDASNLTKPITLWKELEGLKSTGVTVLAAAISPHGNHALVATSGNTAELWNLHTNEHHPLSGAHKAPVEAVAFANLNHLVATGGADGIVKLWDYKQNKLVAEHDFNPALGSLVRTDGSISTSPIPITSVSFSRDLILCSRRDGAAFSWNPKNDVVKIFRHHQDWTSNFSPSADNDYRSHELAATSSKDGTVALWNMNWPGDRPLFTLDTHQQWVTDARFSWDGRRLATARPRISRWKC